MTILASELILNPDGSIYHLGIKPEDLADTVIVVGDPGRVPTISRHFNKIEIKKNKREFCTHTGFYKSKRITVMSTGMGTDNIDIAFTELDALKNINFSTRRIKEEQSSLEIIRIGTTGSLQKNIPVDSFVASEYGLGLDGLMHFYNSEHIFEKEIADEFVRQTGWSTKKAYPYVVKGDGSLLEKFMSPEVNKGLTATNCGFYGPQGRVLRLGIPDPDMNDKIAAFSFQNKVVTNFEMETSAIYGMSKLLGHRALSMNAVIANRATGNFSSDPKKVVANLVNYCLEKLAS
ncbi:phosphorylase [Christiangramia fulva]|uniref:Uridine phosphorylase n=1 Tax=Christiangramia fulva TaxID=2126553 RepID=A0A2R3Z819_9FLAO|nr:nucleoside phosphorylase [Christiangramia fulva]AVR46378.1 phosphorylase [Christiangramia fulva]